MPNFAIRIQQSVVYEVHVDAPSFDMALGRVQRAIDEDDDLFLEDVGEVDSDDWSIAHYQPARPQRPLRERLAEIVPEDKT